MKTKVKRVSKRSLAVLLGVIMLLTSLFVGSIETVNAWNSSTDRLHIRIGSTWYNKYFNSSGVTTFTVDNDNTTIEFELNFNGTLYKLDGSQANFSADGIWDSNGQQRKAKLNATSTYTVTGVHADTYTVTLVGTPDSQNFQDVKINGTHTSSSGGSGSTPSGSESGTAVPSGNLLEVLKGDKIMFYYGDEWGSGTKYLMENETTTPITSGFSSVYFDKCNCAIACVAAQDSSISNNSDWSGTSIGTPDAGKLYCQYTGGYHTGPCDAAVNFSVSSATVRSDATSCNIAATATGKTGCSNDDNVTCELYYTTNNIDFYSFNPANLSGMNLTEGTTYTIKAVAKDTNSVYVLSSNTGTLTVKNDIAASCTLSADKSVLTEVGETVTFTATADTPLQNSLTYKLYESGNATAIESKTTTAGGSVTFTAITSQARFKTYYATVEYTTTPANYNIIQSNDVVINNTDESYIPTYTVTFASNNNSYGTVSAKTSSGALSSGDSVKEGTAVTITAKAVTGHKFKSWSGTTETSSSFTVSVYDNINVTATFSLYGYKVYDGATYYKMRELPTGRWISVDSFVSVGNDSGWLTIQRLEDSNYVHAGAGSNTYWINDRNKIDVSSKWSETVPNVSTNFYTNHTGSASYLTYDPSADKLWLSSNSGDYSGVDVTAKNGTIRTQDGKTHTSDFGTTTVTAKKVTDNTTINATESNAYDSKAVRYALTGDQICDGVQLTVKTVVNSTYAAKGYYVKGFVVSGYEETFSVLWQEFNDDGSEKSSYDDHDKINGASGVESGLPWNEFTLTLNDYYDDPIEITPIYFKKETKSGDNVRFYVDGFAGDVRENWGGTLAIDVFTGSDDDRPFGEYPGQPMINYNGRYMVDIPREGIQGITLNNYVWDHVHSNLFYDTGGKDDHQLADAIRDSNYQTYDFNDFKYIRDKLTALNEDEDIIFSFRYKRDSSHNTKANSNLADVVYYVDSTTSHSGEATDYRTNYSTMTSTHEAMYQFEPLTDFYGNRVDVFGDLVDLDQNATKAAYNPLRVVSNGYDFNKAGKYATAWALYKPNSWDGAAGTYTLADVIGGQGNKDSSGNATFQSESFLVDPASEARVRFKYDGSIRDNTTLASTKYDDAEGSETILGYWQRKFREQNGGSTSYPALIADLVGIPVEITYEYEVQDGKSNQNIEGDDSKHGNKAYRSDGRWYYSSADQLVKAHIIVEYAESKGGTYKRDYFQGNNIDYKQSGYDPSINEGLSTGIKAYFDNSGTETIEGKTFSNTSGYTEANGITDGSYTFDLRTEADESGNYTFDGWYLLVDGKYTLITHNESYDSEATNNDVYVARYYKTPAGNVTISHNLDSNSTGGGTCKAKVEILNDSGTVIDSTTYPETTSSIKVGQTYIKSNSTNKLRITLTTVPDQFSTFGQFKENISGTLKQLNDANIRASLGNSSSADVSVSGTTATITIPIKELFDSNGNQIHKALPFFSLLNKTAYKYRFTYTYPSYMDKYGNQGYVSKGEFTYNELKDCMEVENNALQFVSDAKKTWFLNKKSPYEDNFMQSISWDTSVTPSYTAASLTLSAEIGAITEDTQLKLDIVFPYQHGNEDAKFAYTQYSSEADTGISLDDSITEIVTSHKPKFNEVLSFNQYKTNDGPNGSPDLLTAPKKIHSDDGYLYFRYWSVKAMESSKNQEVEYTRCYNYEFDYVIFQDTVIKPIYTPLDTGESEAGIHPEAELKKDNKGVQISFIENSRNQYNNNQNSSTSNTPASSRQHGADLIYSDFLLSFNNIVTDSDGTPQKLCKIANENEFKCGLIIERVAELDTDASGNYVINSEEEYRDTYGSSLADDGFYSVDKDSGVTRTKDTITTTLGKVIDGSYNSSVDGKGYLKSEMDVKDLDNKNRIEYFYTLANRLITNNQSGNEYIDFDDIKSNKNYVYRAYAYIKRGSNATLNLNGSTGTNYVISQVPVYFTIYETASIQNGGLDS